MTQQLALFAAPARTAEPASARSTKNALAARIKELRAAWRFYRRGGHLPTGFGICADCAAGRTHEFNDCCAVYRDCRERAAEIEAEAARLGGSVR